MRIHQQIIEDVSLMQCTWLQQRYLSLTRITKAKSAPNDSLSSTSMNVPQPKVRKGTLERLHRLRRHRLALAAQLEVVKIDTRQSITNESHKCAPHPEMMDRIRNSASSLPNDDVCNENKEELVDTLLDCAFQNQRLDHVRLLRQSQCLQAAYRLTGISVVSDPNRFILRFDVGKNCYLCIFDIVAVLDAALQPLADDSGLGSPESAKKNTILYLRLIQHTLPASVPFQAILQRTTTLCNSDMIRLGPWHALTQEPHKTAIETSLLWSKIVEKDEIVKQLRNMSLQIHHTCHCLLVRSETWEYLNSLLDATATDNSEANIVKPYSLHHLECSDKSTYQTIRFHINHRLSSIADILISLNYSADLCRPKAHQPSSVKIKISKEVTLFPHRTTPHGSHVEMVVSDVEDRDMEHTDHDEFIENAVVSFRRLPIRKAIAAVAEAMAEY
jgi:hypothetical protein